MPISEPSALEHALTLVGRIHCTDPQTASATEAQLRQWRGLSSDNAEAAETAERLWRATDATGLRDRVPVPSTARQARRTRRRIVSVLGLGATAAATGLLASAAGRWYWQRPLYQATVLTGRAQTLTHALPDTSTLDLAANTEMQVVFHRDRRTVRLVRGEARFDIATDAQRPFEVETAWGRVRVLGTVFTVSARDHQMRVAVARGRVAVWAHPPAGVASDVREAPGALLQRGEAIEANGRDLSRRRSVNADEIADWMHGWLILRDTPLSEAVARWNDYLRQPLQLADDPELHRLNVTGSYPLRNPQAFLDSLTVMMPVRVERATDGRIEIRAQR